MANKKFITGRGPVDTPEVYGDYESARIFDKLHVGSLGVYFREGFRWRFISYDDMDRAFIRIQQAYAVKTVGALTYDYFRMVFVHDGKEFAEYLSEDEKAMDDALAEISRHGVATGFVRAEAS